MKTFVTISRFYKEISLFSMRAVVRQRGANEPPPAPLRVNKRREKHQHELTNWRYGREAKVQLAQTCREGTKQNPANSCAWDGIKTMVNLAAVLLLTTLFIIEKWTLLPVVITGHLALAAVLSLPEALCSTCTFTVIDISLNWSYTSLLL